MFEIGRVCVKTAGRDAKGYCVIVDVLDRNHFLVDGGVRRRKVNSLHLMPLDKKVNLKKGASTADVKKAMDKLGYPMWETKPKKAADRPKRTIKKKELPEIKGKKEKKAEPKKEEPKKPEAKVETKPATKVDPKESPVKPVEKKE